MKFWWLTLLLLGRMAWPDNTNVFIPLEFRNTASGDLVYQGDQISPEDAINLHHEGVDLAKLDPRKGTDIWRDEVGGPLVEDTLNLDVEREVKFLKTSMRVSGTVEFTVQQDNSVYVVRVSRKIHNVLLRKAMLRKIGHIIPHSRVLPRLRVRFEDGAFARNQFLKKDLWGNLFTNPARWIRNFYKIHQEQVRALNGKMVTREKFLFLPRGIDQEHPEAEQLARVNPLETLLEFQDVLVYPISNHSTIMDLSLGFYGSDYNKNLRLLNSVVLPYSLTDVPESINKFTWHLGRVQENILVLPYEEYNHAQQYHPNYEDALWIMNRIAQLERKDFVEIVDSAQYPEELVPIIREKLISRRNHLVKHLNLGYPDLFHWESGFLNSANVVNGVVQKEFWPGHASRFVHSEVDSPLSGTEVLHFMGSKTISNVIRNFMNTINEQLQAFDLPAAWQERYFDQLFQQFFETGELQNAPLGIWTHPTLNGQLIFEREVVLGTYMGVGGREDGMDRMINLADTFGFAVAGGVIGLLEGIPLKHLVHINGNVFLSRNYTHLKPLNNIKESLKKPPRHILVGLYRNETVQVLNELLDGKLDELDEKQREEKIKSALASFKKDFRVGESLIITDTLGGGIGAVGRYGLLDNLHLQARISDHQIVIGRLHIQRADEHTIHIYRDYGNYNSLRLAFDMDGHLPMVGLSVEVNNGRAKTLYHHLNINPDESENPFLIDNIRNLKNVLLTGSLEMFQANPVILEHHFHEKVSHFRLFSYRRTSLNNRDRIVITHPNGEKAEFMRGSRGHRTGKDWQGLGVDTVNAVIREQLDRDDNVLNIVGNNDPGDSFQGSSRYRLINMDTLITRSEQGEQTLTESFVHINHRWKGWSLSRSSANDIIQEINTRFEFEFFNPRVLSNTQNILLYLIDLKIFVYEPAIEFLLQTSKERAAGLFAYYAKDEKHLHLILDAIVDDFESKRKKCREMRSGNEVEQAIQPCVQMVDLVENYVRHTNGLIAFFGGRENFRMEAQILGYRKGDESAFDPINSNVFGEIGAAKPIGPLWHVLSNPDFRIPPGEFFLYWLMTKL